MSSADKVVLMLRYYRRYETFAQVGFDFGVAEATAHNVVTRTERVLINSGLFKLPSKKELLDQDGEQKVLIVDATDTLIQRPKKTKNLLFQQTQTPHAPNPADHCG